MTVARIYRFASGGEVGRLEDYEDWFPTKREAVASARFHAINSALSGVPTSVRIKKQDGKIQEERTYGRNPKRSKG